VIWLLEIFSLGKFLVRKGQKTLSESSSRSKKVWDLFKFFLAHHDQTLLPEVISDKLWQDEECADPRNSVRTLVHRLRVLLDDNAQSIIFSQGGYIFKTEGNFWWDIQDFEPYRLQAKRELNLGNNAESIALYRHAISLYKGNFLPECVDYDWLFPYRNYYHHQYLNSVNELLALLRKSNLFSEIISEVDKAFIVDYFEEEFHHFYLEALLAEGKVSNARAHYQNATGVFYRELGVKPSEAFKQYFQLIQSSENDFKINKGLRLNNASKNLKKINPNQSRGAFFCDYVFFERLLHLESRRSERNGQQVALALLTVRRLNDNVSPEHQFAETMLNLEKLLLTGLRRGDVISRRSENEFIILLSESNEEQAQKALRRIAGSVSATKGKELGLEINFLPL